MRPSAAGLCLVLTALSAAPACAQSETSGGGSTGAAVGLAALGFGAAGLLAGAGALVPCTESAAGPDCVRAAALAGGTVGLATGAVIGAQDAEQARDRLRGAGIGLGLGVAAALVAGPKIENFGWKDGLAFGALGAAIGTAPEGAGLGVAVGSVLGLVLWKTVPGVDLPDAVAITIGGLAAGALVDWTLGAIESDEAAAPVLVVSLPVRW